MNYAIWFVVGVLIGLLVWISPVIWAPSFGIRRRQAVADHYWQMCFKLLGRAMLVRRKHSGWELASSSYDAGMEAEKVTLDDQTLRFEDPRDNMGRAYGVPFGLAWEKFDVILSPLDAEVGEMDKRDELEYGNEIEVEDTHFVRNQTVLPKARRLIDLVTAEQLMLGDSSPKDADTVEEFIEKSQAAYNSRDLIGVGTMIMAFAAGGGLIWFVLTQGGKVSRGVGSGINVGLQIVATGVL